MKTNILLLVVGVLILIAGIIMLHNWDVEKYESRIAKLQERISQDSSWLHAPIDTLIADSIFAAMGRQHLESPDTLIGILIELSDDYDKILNDIMSNSKAKYKCDVLVEYGKERKSFTLTEFLTKLGFEKGE